MGKAKAKLEEAPKNKGGRPSEFAQETADAICERIAAGESVRGICADEDMPCATTVFKWLGDFPEFAKQYARAREEQAETFAAQIVAIADEECTTVRADKHHGTKPDTEGGYVEVVFDATAVARNRLRVDARKWVAAKLKPKVYGDKLQHSNDPDNPIQPPTVNVTFMRPD